MKPITIITITTVAILAMACELPEPDGYVDPIGPDGPLYTLWVESARLDSTKVETFDYLPDPVAQLLEGGDLEGWTREPAVNTFDPAWGQPVATLPAWEWVGGEWSVNLVDYEVDPQGPTWLGACSLSTELDRLEHEVMSVLVDCSGAVDVVRVRWEESDND